jgi:hypothetical protein
METGPMAPLNSVLEATEGELLEAMFAFYSIIAPEPILRCHLQHRPHLEGSSRNVVSMDIDPKYNPMIVCDNRKMTGVPDAHFGTIIYDQPMLDRRDETKVASDSTSISAPLSSSEKSTTGTAPIFTRRF